MAFSFIAILFLSRGMAPSPDELSFFITTPRFSAREALAPYGGHLILTTRCVYRVLLEIFGSAYLPFRVLAASTVLLTVGCLYAYVSRAIGRVAALAPCFVLLVFGSDSLHVLAGNSFTVLLPVACGTAALLAADRGTWRGDLAACLLLTLAVATYSTGLAVLAGVSIAVLLRPDRWRRAWIFLVPGVLYLIWFIWARTSFEGSGSGIAISNVLLLPAWAFESLGAVLSSIAGLNYQFTGAPPIGAAAPLALVALAALVWRFTRGLLPRAFWPALTAICALWALQCLASKDADNFPGSPHYLFPATVLALLAIAQATRGVRWTATALIVLFAVAAVGVGTNLSVLRREASKYRYEYTPVARAALTGLEVAGASADPDFDFGNVQGVDLNLYRAFRGTGDNPTAAYLEAVKRFGGLGYPPDELRETGRGSQPREAAIADSVLASATDFRVQAGEPVAGEQCRRAVPSGPGQVSFDLPAGRGVVVKGASGPIIARRFAESGSVTLGSASANQPFSLRAPPDSATGRPWRITVVGPSARVCEA